jgi:hypothetical protein
MNRRTRTCTHTHTYLHTHEYALTTHIHTHTHACTHTHAHKHTHTHTHTRTQTHTHIQTHTHTHTHMYTRTHTVGRNSQCHTAVQDRLTDVFLRYDKFVPQCSPIPTHKSGSRRVLVIRVNVNVFRSRVLVVEVFILTLISILISI